MQGISELCKMFPAKHEAIPTHSAMKMRVPHMHIFLLVCQVLYSLCLVLLAAHLVPASELPMTESSNCVEGGGNN